ncbi:MAG: hypothetical protein AAGB27_13310 [Pseudomonadota bacterium]
MSDVSSRVSELRRTLERYSHGVKVLAIEALSNVPGLVMLAMLNTATWWSARSIMRW